VCGKEISRTKTMLPALGPDMKATEKAAEPSMEGSACVGWKPGTTVTACTRCGEVASTVIHKVETRPAMKTGSWSYENGTLDVTCAAADWPSAKVSDYLAQAGFYGYAGTLNGNDCLRSPALSPRKRAAVPSYPRTGTKPCLFP
jgi:hypothetical protein